MPLVSVELSMLKDWLRRLDSDDVSSVSESMFDEIQRIELNLKTKNEELEQMKREREEQIEKIVIENRPLTFNEIQIGCRYRLADGVTFRNKVYEGLRNPEVEILSKGRTRISALILEPGYAATGKTVTVHASHLINK